MILDSYTKADIGTRAVVQAAILVMALLALLTLWQTRQASTPERASRDSPAAVIQ